MMTEITKTAESTTSDPHIFVKILLGILTVFIYFFGLTIPLVGPDEPRYAQVAREMFEKGDWVTPTLGGFTWFEKPALLYWLEIASFHLFGVNEFAARFGPALFGLGTIVSLWVFGKVIAGENARGNDNGSNNLPYYLSLIAASAFGLIVFSRGASFDIIITFPLTAALVSFFIWHIRSEIKDRLPRQGSRSIVPLVLFYFFIGMALLAKGLIGIVFPFAIVAFYYLLSWRLPSLAFIFSLFWGTLIAAAVAAIWYGPVYINNGYPFIDEFFVQHHFQRFTSNKFQHPQPFYFFLWILPLMTLPWLPLFLASIWPAIRKVAGSYKKRDNSTEVSGLNSQVTLFSFAWLLVPLVFFSLSGSKLPGYILPSVPAAIVLTALYVTSLARKRSSWATAFQGIALAVFIATIVALLTVVPRFADTDSVKALIQKANERGYTDAAVLSLHTISHNAEFYAAGRLLRDETGKQKRLYGPTEVLAEIRRENGKKVLVLVPLEYLVQVTSNDKLESDTIADNGELAILIVAERRP